MTTKGAHQGRDDRRRLRPRGLAATHPQQAAARRPWPNASAIATDPLQVVLVRDMWLTGFDAPSLHTMYVDKPMRGHGLMQAIARVNRVFKDKPGGLIVDYLGLAQDLKKALATYTESGGEGETALDQEKAVAIMLEKYDVCRGHLPRLRLVALVVWNRVRSGLDCCRPPRSTSLAQEDGKQRFLGCRCEN